MSIIDIIKRSNKNLFRSKLRTVLTILAVFIGAATLTLTIAIGEGVKGFIDQQTKSIATEGTLIIAKVTAGSQLSTAPQEYKTDDVSKNGVQYFSQEDVDKITPVAGIQKVITYNLIQTEYITAADAKKYKITVAPQVNEIQFPIISGQIPDDAENGFIILPYSFVDALGFGTTDKAIGKTVTIYYKNALGQQASKDLLVKAVMINSLVTNTRGYISQTDANDIANYQNANTQFQGKYAALVALIDPNSTKTQIDTIKADLQTAGYSATTVDDELQTVNGIITAVQIVLSVFGVIAILVSTFGIVNTLLMSIYERTKEIGLFRALGMGKSNLFLMFAMEAAAIGFWGGITGVTFAYLIGQVINRIVEQSNLFGFEGFKLLVFPMPYMIYIVVGLVVVSLIAGVLPARKGANLDPIAALRYE